MHLKGDFISYHAGKATPLAANRKSMQKQAQ